MPLSKAQRAARKLEDLVILQRTKLALGQEKPVVCELHSWRPDVPAGAPLPPASMCPACLEEALPLPAPRRDRHVDHPLEIDRLKPGQYDLILEAIDKHPRHRQLAGTQDEDAALQAIDAAREAERDALDPKPFGPRSRVATQRIEPGTGTIVTFHEVAGFSGLVQVGPER